MSFQEKLKALGESQAGKKVELVDRLFKTQSTPQSPFEFQEEEDETEHELQYTQDEDEQERFSSVTGASRNRRKTSSPSPSRGRSNSRSGKSPSQARSRSQGRSRGRSVSRVNSQSARLLSSDFVIVMQVREDPHVVNKHMAAFLGTSGENMHFCERGADPPP
jgi:hypothetical protein